MASLVITDAGITLKSYQELRDELKSEWTAAFGQAIDLSPTSVDGHHIDLECKTITSVSQLIAAVAANLDPKKATGVWLDILGDYKSMHRVTPSYSVATVTFEGTAGTVVPQGTTVRYDGAPCDFVLQADVTLDSEGTGTGECKAAVIGAVEVYVGDWTMVSSSPSGVTCSVEEEDAGGTGRDAETDAQFRARQDSYTGSGLAVEDKMYAYMAGVVGEGNFSLKVNDEDYAVDGIPGHRFMFTIKNGIGTNDEIAQAIWNCKPAGIKPFGNVSGEAESVTGLSHTMYFSRPVETKLWIIVEITEYDEEQLPANYAEAISAAVFQFASEELSPGKDVIPKRFYGPVYKAVPGILDVVVKACISDTEPLETDYTENRIAVEPQEVAVVQRVAVDLV